jgi:hypothetical protein
MDGSVWHENAAGDTWANLRNGAGTNYSNPTNDAFFYFRCGTTSNTYTEIDRYICTFGTSGLTEAATISAAILSLYGTSKADLGSWTPNINIYTSAPASNNQLAAGDYDSVGTVVQCDTAITYAGWSTAGYNDFTFNATGLGNISKTGISKFGARNANYDVANSPPTWGSGNPSAHVSGYHADQTGTTNDPKLAVAYTLNTGTVLTEYPDADPETNTVDGYIGGIGGTTVTWAALIADTTGSYATDNTSPDDFLYIQASTFGHDNFWTQCERSVFLFDTSGLTLAATITAAVLSLYGSSKSDNLGITPNIDIYTSNPASNTGLVAGDYDNFGSVSQTGSPITYTNFSTAGYNDFTFNATGIGNISKTGISKYGARNANYDVAATPPTWTSSLVSQLNGYYAEQTGTANDPKLVVTYSTYTEDVPYVIAYVTRTDLFAGSSRT